MSNSYAKALELAAEAVKLPREQLDGFLADHCDDEETAKVVMQLVLGRAEAEGTEGSLDETAAWSPDESSLQDLSHDCPEDEDPLKTIGSEGVGDGAPLGKQFSDLVSEDAGELTLSSNEQSEVGEICRRFSEAWESGKTPLIRDFVPSVDDQSFLRFVLRQLVAIDVRKREERRLSVDAEAICSSLPEYRDVILSAISAAKTERQRSTPQSPTTKRSGKTEDWTFSEPHPLSERYHLVNPHARGGLGEVYRAKDRELNRIVALKTIRSRYDAEEENRKRFVFEAEITGLLEHPGIIPVHSLGRFGSNSPYYTMRFIRGESLRDAVTRFHMQNRKLSSDTFLSREFRQFLQQLIDCCNAMHFAHEHKVLHRDLKPDNIMLGSFGETLVVDWGLAKLIDEKGRPNVMDESQLSAITSGSNTSQGSVVGTPLYMSPEQAKGLNDELLPTTDIYSLGAILFFIVSGKPPVKGRSARDIVFRVQSGELTSLPELVPAVPLPLVSICERALQKEPDERYQSARELADDIDRWLGDEQVHAHADRETNYEKAGRLLRRYRGWTVSGGISLFVVTLIAVSSAFLISRAKQRELFARQRAEAHRKEAIAFYQNSLDAIDTLVEGTDRFDGVPGTQSLRRELLDTADQYFVSLAETKVIDPELQLERARAKIKAGDIASRQRDSENARLRYEEASEMLRRQIDAGFQDENRALLYALEQQRAVLRKAALSASEKDYANAVINYENAIDELVELVEKANNVELRRQLASAHINLGELHRDRGKFQVAERHFNLGAGIWESLAVGGNVQDRLALADTETLVGRFYRDIGNEAAAVESFGQSIQRLRHLVEIDPANRELIVSFADALMSQAEMMRAAGNQSGLDNRIREAGFQYALLSEAMPDVPEYAEKRCEALVNLGLVLIAGERCREAVSPLEEAVQVANGLATIFGSDAKSKSLLAAANDGLAIANLYQGRASEALEHSVRSVVTYLELCDEFANPPDFVKRLAIARSHHAQVIGRQQPGNREKEEIVDEASEHFELALEDIEFLIESASEPEYADLRARIRYRYGLFLYPQDQAGATKQFELARDGWMQLGSHRGADSSERLAWLLATCPAKPVRDIGKSIEFAEEAYSVRPANGRFKSTLALAYLESEETARAQDLMEAAAPSDGLFLGRVALTRSLIHRRLGNHADSETFLNEGKNWFQENAPNYPDYKILASLVVDDQ